MHFFSNLIRNISVIKFCMLLFSSPQENVEISSFHINSTVTSRYAITVITMNLIINLVNTYDGVVKEKEAAQQQYSEAVARGESAGVVRYNLGRTLEEFKTSVTVAALSKVTFELTYEELLQRRHGKYDLLIHTQPMQPVIDVYIKENPDISFLEVKGDLYTDELAWIHFYPTSDQQTKCLRCTADGLDGDLIITYDVERKNPNGDIQVIIYNIIYLYNTALEKMTRPLQFLNQFL
uniref:VIT domain-containing protein n=1 Tax=Astyanax mexicanus TaxID=7994 RepID=A0A3B1JMI5_ASTMX